MRQSDIQRRCRSGMLDKGSLQLESAGSFPCLLAGDPIGGSNFDSPVMGKGVECIVWDPTQRVDCMLQKPYGRRWFLSSSFFFSTPPIVPQSPYCEERYKLMILHFLFFYFYPRFL